MEDTTSHCLECGTEVDPGKDFCGVRCILGADGDDDEQEEVLS